MFKPLFKLSVKDVYYCMCLPLFFLTCIETVCSRFEQMLVMLQVFSLQRAVALQSIPQDLLFSE